MHTFGIQFSRSVVSNSLQPHGIGIILNCQNFQFLKIWEIVWMCADSLDTKAPLTEDHLGLIKLTGSHSIRFKTFMFSRSVVSNSLWPHELQHARPPCPSPTPGVHSNSCPLSWWCHPTISSSVVPFSSCPQSFPASGCFQMSQLFASGNQSIGVSASTSVLPMNTRDWSPLG